MTWAGHGVTNEGPTPGCHVGVAGDRFGVGRFRGMARVGNSMTEAIAVGQVEAARGVYFSH